MAYSVGVYLVCEGADDGVLTHDFAPFIGAELAVKRGVLHIGPPEFMRII